MISIPPTSSLEPVAHRLANGRMLYAFPTTSTELVRIDFLTDSGSAYQPQLLCAAAANRLSTAASAGMSAHELSEFIDYRGIVVDSNSSVTQCSTTFYTLRRHLHELLPVLDGLLHQPTFPEEEFAVYQNKRRQKLAAMRGNSSDMARRLFYEALFSTRHPLGVYAEVEDAERLNLDVVRSYYAERHRVGDTTILLSGNVDDRLVRDVDALFGHDAPTPDLSHISFTGTPVAMPSRCEMKIAESVQATLRVGCIVPLAWDDPDYAQLMLLVTLLGGYFGSRLMANLREDKGYTYGIYARTQIYRGVIVFYITADVAGSAVDDAEREIMHELQRLVDEPVGEEELDLVRTVLVGDFLRSVDGIFERASRFADMLGTDLDERLTDNIRHAIATATPAGLQRLAAAHLAPQLMTICRAGSL